MSIVNAPTFIPTPWKGLPLIPEVVRVDDVCLARLMNDFRVGNSLLLGDWSTRTGVLAKGARTDDGRGNEEGDVMAAGVA